MEKWKEDIKIRKTKIGREDGSDSVCLGFEPSP
jgi:hypothetical protein